MKFSTKGISTQSKPKKVSKYISYGNNLLKINDITVKTAQSGSKQLILNVETKPIDDPTFEPEMGYEGRVGKVAFPGVYIKLDDEKALENFYVDVATIAEKLGVRDQLDQINADSFDEYIDQLKDIFKGKYAYWAIAGEEYVKATGGVGIKLKTRRYKFIASLSEGEQGLGAFDASQTYNFKKTELPDAQPATNESGGLPF